MQACRKTRSTASDVDRTVAGADVERSSTAIQLSTHARSAELARDFNWHVHGHVTVVSLGVEIGGKFVGQENVHPAVLGAHAPAVAADLRSRLARSLARGRR